MCVASPINSSSGMLLLCGRLTGHRKQLWYGPPGKPCHQLQTSLEISFSLFLIHLSGEWLCSCLACKALSSTRSLLEVQPSCPSRSYQAALSLVGLQAPASHRLVPCNFSTADRASHPLAHTNSMNKASQAWLFP